MIKDLLNKIVENDAELYSVVGRVISVDTQKNTCNVLPLNGDAEIKNVWLLAELSGTNGILIVPKIESIVIVTMMSDTTAFLSKTGDIDFSEFRKDDLLINVSEKGIYINVDNENLAKTISDFIKEMKGIVSTLRSFVLLTSNGPTTGVSPSSMLSLDSHETNLNKIEVSLYKIFVE